MAEEATATKQTRSFETETARLLDLMIHSIYTHKEIFLRELISNASDALDKLRFESLTNSDLLKEGEELAIELTADKDARMLTVSDNGIGMTYDEVVENLGTIARSGSKAFIEAMKKSKEEGESVDLIGQFGVGFYSSFMVAEYVTVVTKKAGEEKAVRWESKGDGTYTIEETDKATHGTDVILKLRPVKEDADADEPDALDKDYLSPFALEQLVKKYSDYIRYPIKIEMPLPPKPKSEDDKEEADDAPTTEVKTVNSMTSLWSKSKNDITEDEYNQFFKSHFHGWADPADVIHTKAEGTLEYTALLFLPSKAPFDLYTPDYNKGIQLYSKNVFIMEDCKDLLPDYLKFVRGLVDSPDFSLNISREILQHNRFLKKIGKNLEKKVLDAMKKMLENDREKYKAFFKEFGEILKVGVYSHFDAKEKLQDLLLFPTSANADEPTTLKEYVSRMKEGQKHIYFAAGQSREHVERLPQMEQVREKGYEVLYFINKTDEFITLNLKEYDGKQLHSVSRGDIDLEEGEKPEEEKKKEEELKEKSKGLIEAIKENLKDKVQDVRLSKRLASSPVCLVTNEAGLSLNMEQVIQDAGAKQMMPSAERILELNPNHALFTVLEKEYEACSNSDMVKEYSELLYTQSLLMEGHDIENPADFASRIAKLMVDAGSNVN